MYYLLFVIFYEKWLIQLYTANFKPSNKDFIYSEHQNDSILYITGDNPYFNQSQPWFSVFPLVDSCVYLAAVALWLA